MPKSGPENPIHFSLDGDKVIAISQQGNDLLVSHFIGKINLDGCIQIKSETPPNIIFDSPVSARSAWWLLESLARLGDDAHLLRQMEILIKMKS